MSFMLVFPQKSFADLSLPFFFDSYDDAPIPPVTYSGTTFSDSIVYEAEGVLQAVLYYNLAPGTKFKFTDEQGTYKRFYYTEEIGLDTCGPNWMSFPSAPYIQYNSSVIFGSNINILYSTQTLYAFDGVTIVRPSDLNPPSSTFNFPLSESLENRTILLGFGDTWIFGECPTSVYKKHAGIDLSATEDEEVYAAHDGTVKAIYTGQHAQWADAIVIEDDNQQYTTVYWHVIKYGDLAVNDHVTKGQQIATVADLGTNTHFHFGFRSGSYNSSFSLAGALPEEDCGGYLAFPENFLDPSQLTYE